MSNQPHMASGEAEVQVAAAHRPQTGRKAGPFILILCLIVAIAAVLFVPMFVGGASSQSSSVSAATVSQPQAEQSFASLSDAAAALGFTPLVPAEVPAGFTLTAIRTLDGGMLELEYTSGRSSILFRTAPGSDDLSGDNTEYAYTATIDEEGAARSYSGASEQKLNLAVWAQGDASYAVIAPQGLSTDEMHTITQSVGA